MVYDIWCNTNGGIGMNKDKINIEDIHNENLSVARKIAEESEKTELPKRMSEEELNHFLDNNKKTKKRNVSRKIAALASLAACVAIVIGTIENVVTMNQNKASDFKCVISGRIEENSDIESDLSYAQIYEKLSAIRMENNKSVYGTKYADAQNFVESVADSSSASSASSEQNSYYNTNEQTENVNEGDIVKTDGKYIYILNSDKNYIKILYADGKNTNLAGKIKLSKNMKEEGNYDFSEIYIKDNILIVMGNIYSIDECNGYAESCCGMYTPRNTIILFYDVTDMENIKLLNTLKQDGDYNTSRLNGNYLYIVSNEYIDEITKEDCVPKVNGENIDAKAVYIPKNTDGSEYVVVTTVNIFKSEKFADAKAVASGYAEIYMSEDNLYLSIYNQEEKDISDTEKGKKALKGLDTQEKEIKVKKEYKNYIKQTHPEIDVNKISAKQKIVLLKEIQQSEIVKLNYKEGELKIVADGKVDGSIDDNLSMDEYKGYLRMVTSVNVFYSFLDRVTYYDENNKVVGYVDLYSEELDEYYLEPETYNNLYVLNLGLNIAASIENLAKNEDIYSARFLGDYGYFVTYENTDPLFSVDFSNIENPQIIGKLKMTGFSDYLHFYSENLLFGLGMETDSKTGIEKGLKLDMYDISNYDAKLQSKLVLEDVAYTEALYNYKAIMIDGKKNIIGFAQSNYYQEKNVYEYCIYSYNQEKQEFEKKAEIELSNGGWETRGLYVGEKIYIVSTDGTVTLVDMDSFEIEGTYEF